MCGICGEIRFDGQPVNPAVLAAMNDVQAPRGPDGAGVYAQGRMGFCHRRLKIIDLSERAQQPMVDPELGIGVVFNGCIYNYPELRAELQDKGYRFFSHGDTEVILKAYHAWGEDFVKRLYGMFAFAIWERESGRVVMGRDRQGIKPLYLARDGKSLRFASTLPALLKSGGVDTTIDPVALYHYMSFHAVVPAPRTLFKGVTKLPPGTLLVIEPDGTERQSTYWSLTFGPQAGDAARSSEEWDDMVLDALKLAVKRRLVADVPVGVLLSGGLDSSLLVALLDAAGQGEAGLKTFSIGFETVGNEKGDEFQYSDIIVDRFKTDHMKLFVEGSEVLTALDRCVGAMAEPMVSHDVVAFYLLSREVSKHVKVVQSGQGADEVFGGYHWYPPMLEATDVVADYGRVFRDRSHAEMMETLGPDFRGADHAETFLREALLAPGATLPIDQAMRLDTTVMLVEDPVKRVDNMTMAWGLEARVPFLDHELVELAARMPAELKLDEGGKGVLKRISRKLLPHEVIDRPKGYFPVPALKYLQGPYLEHVRDLVNQPSALARGLFDRAYVDKLLAAPEDHITPLRGSKLWQIALLEYWLQTHLDGAGTHG